MRMAMAMTMTMMVAMVATMMMTVSPLRTIPRITTTVASTC